ncbi:Gag polyprotein [Carex littledalei]|uniref:Gag polyprotein n=1 Tax=Carex littledalei TaxID=544730 RepID=A0A833VXD6_9POAL|nr:Gag polyprotein [Carex littledalei]
MAIREAIFNGGETIDKTKTTLHQDRTGEEESHDKDDNRKVSVKLPTLIIPNLGNFQEEENIFRVGEHPILRVIPSTNNEEQDSLQRIQIQPPSINISQQGNNALSPSQLKINSESKRGQGLETAAHNENLEGWTLVTRRKKRSTPQASPHRRNQQSYMHIHATKLRQQQKCFKCLMKGHIQAACRNPRRCLHCNLTGHIVRHCPSMPGGSSRVSQGSNIPFKERSVPTKETHIHNRHSQKHPHNPPHHQKSQRKNMEAPRNWLTMAMNEPGELWQERPHHLNVYLAPRAELSPANLFLERSAFVFAGPGRSDPYLKQRIVNCMGRQFHCDASEFGVFIIDEDFGDLLIIFPTADMAATAIEQGSFYLGNNIEIALHPYSPDLQLAFDPMGGRARIRLYGVPLNHWNRLDMATLVAGFGYPLRVAPYFTNGNYQYLTMLVACKKAEEVPFFLKLKVNPYKTNIRVEMEGWLSNQRPPPPNYGNDTTDRRYRGRNRQRDNTSGTRDNSPRRSPPARRNRDQERNRGQRNDGNRSSAGSNRTRAAHDWIVDLKRKLIETGLLTGEVQTQQGGMQGPALLQSQQDLNGSSALEIFGGGDTTMTNKSGTGFKYRFTKTTISDGNQFISGTMAVASHEFLPTGELKFMCFEKGKLTEKLNSAEYFQETEMGYNIIYGNGVSGPKRASLQLIEEGQASGFGLEQGQSSNALANSLDVPILQVLQNQGADENQGPPPGFDFPTYAANSQQELAVNEPPVQQGAGTQQELNATIQQVRKSARLTEKYSGGRVRYNSGKRKYKRGNAKFKPVRLEYQNSLEPLDKEQAVKVIEMAGVRLFGKIDEEVEKIVFK